MLATKVACPSCLTPLRTTQPLPAGQRVRCPRCGIPFTVGPSETVQAPAAIQPPHAPLRGFAPPPLLPVPAPPPQAPLPETPAPANRGLVLVCVLGGLLLLAGTSIGLAFLFSGGGKETTNKPSDPNKDGGPHAATDNTNRDDRDARRARDEKEVKAGKDRDAGGDGRVDLRDTSRRAVEQTVNLSKLPPEEQKRVNEALIKGIAYLKKTQLADGTWHKSYNPLGCAALPALTLLECGVPADDPVVQKAAAFVRKHAPTNPQTYQISLAILLLDRLGEPRDRELIQTLGLRLIAGQTPGGGWSYGCRVLDRPNNRAKTSSQDLMVALQQTRPLSSRELHLEVTPNDSKTDLRPSEINKETFEKATVQLPADLKRVPALQPPDEKASAFPGSDGSDNSNTQFGLLGVWVAGRHGVPTERSLALVARRFRVSQNPQGTWGYHYRKGGLQGGTPSMIAAGLLGLAVGHGVSTGPENADGPKKVDDPLVNKAMKALSQHIGKALGTGRKNNRLLVTNGINLYFLWSMERVGMLYNTAEIGGKDWYAWGAELLVDSQSGEGSWMVSGYHNNANPQLTDTCFALLFLKRANLVKDLSNKLEFIIDAK